MPHMKIPNLTCTGLGFRLPAAMTLAAPAIAYSGPEFSKESLNLENALCIPSCLAPSQAMSLTGTLKALVQLAREQGHLTHVWTFLEFVDAINRVTLFAKKLVRADSNRHIS